MEKRKFDLSKDMIRLEREEEESNFVPQYAVTPNSSEKKVEEEQVERLYLSLRVTEEFKKEFKIWCTYKGLKQNEAIVKIFNKIKSLEDF